MGFPILVRCHLCIESAPWLFSMSQLSFGVIGIVLLYPKAWCTSRDQILKQYLLSHKKLLWKFFRLRFDLEYTTGSTCCTCQDSSAVGARANWWADWHIILQINVIYISTRFGLRVQNKDNLLIYKVSTRNAIVGWTQNTECIYAYKWMHQC